MIKRKQDDFKKKEEEKAKPIPPLFKLREFKNKPSVVQTAIQKNNLQDINCCYTKAGKSYSSEEYERIVYEQIGPSSSQRRKGPLSNADQDLMNEEKRLIEDYYKHYNGDMHYQTPPHKSKKLVGHDNLKAHNITVIKKRNPALGERSVAGGISNDSRQSSKRLQAKPSKRLQPQPIAPEMEEMNEDERMSLIAKLDKRKQDILSLIQRLPVCNRSHAVELKEKEYFRMIDEIDEQNGLLYNKQIFFL